MYFLHVIFLKIYLLKIRFKNNRTKEEGMCEYVSTHNLQKDREILNQIGYFKIFDDVLAN